MTSKQALKIAINSNNQEFNTLKSSIDNQKEIAGCFHFVVNNEKFCYFSDSIKTGCKKFNGYTKLIPVMID